MGLLQIRLFFCWCVCSRTGRHQPPFQGKGCASYQMTGLVWTRAALKLFFELCCTYNVHLHTIRFSCSSSYVCNLCAVASLVHSVHMYCFVSCSHVDNVVSLWLSMIRLCYIYSIYIYMCIYCIIICIGCLHLPCICLEVCKGDFTFNFGANSRREELGNIQTYVGLRLQLLGPF